MRRLLAPAMVLLLTSLAPGQVQAQDLAALFADFEAAEDTTRVNAFYQLLGGYVPDAGPAIQRLLDRRPADRDRIAVALIALLEKENARLQLDPPIMTEYEGMYWGDLVWAVATLRDPRALNALLTARSSSGLVALGEVAIPGVIQRLDTASHWLSRSAAAQTLAMMVERRAEIPLSPVSVSTIRASLLRAAASDEHGGVRMGAVMALIHFDDQEVRRVMVEMAKSDRWTPRYGPAGRYLVREAAQEWLRKHGGGGPPH